jgi:hypothetical protein
MTIATTCNCSPRQKISVSALSVVRFCVGKGTRACGSACKLRFEIFCEQYAFGKTKNSNIALRLLWIIRTFGHQNSWDVEWYNEQPCCNKGSDLKVLHVNFVLLPHVVTKLSAGMALCISDVESWAEVSGIPVPPLCPVPHRGEGVNKVGCMNCEMFIIIMGNSTVVLAEIRRSTVSWYESVVTLFHIQRTVHLRISL